MWRCTAPLAGRAGGARRTDGPSRLNISVTSFPNCVVAPEAGTAVRAKQSGAERSRRAAVCGIHINTRVSHGITIRSAPKWRCLHCPWILRLAPCFLSTATRLPSLYPFSVLQAKFKLCVSVLFLFPGCPVPPPLFPSRFRVSLPCML